MAVTGLFPASYAGQGSIRPPLYRTPDKYSKLKSDLSDFQSKIRQSELGQLFRKTGATLEKRLEIYIPKPTFTHRNPANVSKKHLQPKTAMTTNSAVSAPAKSKGAGILATVKDAAIDLFSSDSRVRAPSFAPNWAREFDKIPWYRKWLFDMELTF